MPARDLFHDAVRHALEKEGWNITHDPYLLQMGTVEMAVDLGAERMIAAERAHVKIVIEIKSFARPSSISEFHVALGQYLNYEIALEEQEPDRTLYLAVPLDAHESFFATKLAQKVISRYPLRRIVYEPYQEVIVEWLQ